MAGSLSVNVVSATESVYTGEAKTVVARTTEGELGVLPGHQPLLAILGSGEVRITLLNGEKIVADARDGFISVENDTVTIVAGHATLVG